MAAAVLGQPAVVLVRAIFGRYGDAGGGLLAGGLAYAALFAIVPGVILLAGVVGIVYADAENRDAAVAVIVSVVPPLRNLIETVLEEAAQNAASVSIVGAVTLAWGTSRFVVALEGAIARVMGGDSRRGVVIRNLGALAAVVLMFAAIPASAVLSGVAEFLKTGAELGILQVAGEAIATALGVLPIVGMIGATVLVYRIVPQPRPSWRDVVIPGIAVGVVLSIIARAFAFLAPRLIGAAALVGTLATVFVALAWLALSFQAILLGAAWVRERGDRAAAAGTDGTT